MSRISRYQESISRFIKTKSSYSTFIKKYNFDNILDLNDHEQSIVMLTILTDQCNKKGLKKQFGYYMASGIDLMMNYVMLNDNILHYESTFDKKTLQKFITQMPIHTFECLSQNIEILENIPEKEKILKLHRKIHTFLSTKLLEITNKKEFKSLHKINKTDIIKYKFKNKEIINTKYKKLSMIDKDELLNYIEQTYGSVCQCSFVIGWLFGLGDEKMIYLLENIGISLGFLIKISEDFKNLERDINSANVCSTNLIVNYGIHESFSLFDEHKLKLLQGTLTLNIYNITIKEIIDNIEKKFDSYLQNTDLELVSKYSSFTSLN